MGTEAIARPAATILLLRDGADGVEVFMVVRHHQIDFAAGALVFPGGRVEEADHALSADSALCPNPDQVDPSAMAFRIAAIRETFEECGVLFARPAGGGDLISAEALLTVEARHRAALAQGTVSFSTVLAAHNLQAAPDCLAYFAHWITPNHQPKRYDTHFYLAAAPAAHLAVHDGSESVDSVWISPQQALAETRAGRFKLVFATEKNLEKIARFRTAAEALQSARTTPVVTVLPELLRTEGRRRVLRIPEEAGYGGSEFEVENAPAS